MHRPGDWRVAGLLANLNDTVLRQTKTGNSSGHRKRGDEMAALYEPDTEKSRPSKQGEASRLLDVARNTLSTIVRDICETRGIDYPATTSAAAAQWLAEHVHTLACDDAAGLWKREIDGLVRSIERLIDRPRDPGFCGQCDTMLTDENGRRKMCGVAVYAHREAIEVTCPNRKCRTLHNIEKLYTRTLNSSDHRNFPKRVLLDIMRGLETPISSDSFDRYVRNGYIKARMFLRPCGQCPECAAKTRHRCERGRHAFFRHGPDDIPEYRLEDLRNIKRDMEKNQKSGKALT